MNPGEILARIQAASRDDLELLALVTALSACCGDSAGDTCDLLYEQLGRLNIDVP